jgi:glutamyl-tRNA synthetase
MSDKLEKEMLAYSLQNAIDFGKAKVGKVLPKLFRHGLEKDKISTIMPSLSRTINKVNSLSPSEKEIQFEKLKSLIKTQEIVEKTLPPLPNVKGKVVVRLAPFPSGALHIGNAKQYILNAIYAEKYKGKIILVMDDTIGSAEKPPLKVAYKLLEDAFKILGIKYSKPIFYKSNRLPIYYNYAEKLIKKDKAYACYCSQKQVKLNREQGKECKCRNLPWKEHLQRWKYMFNQKEGDAVLRLKTNMNHPNPAFRDRILFKISDRKHPKTQGRFRVWPSLEMSWSIDDHLLGITHIIRGNDLEMETQMEKYIWDIFKWKHPESIHTGMINISGMDAKISKSKAQKEVLSGQFIGWDDPRTWSIQSLERRGIKKQAIRNFFEDLGVTKQNITVPIESLYAINRRLIDLEANRYSFVKDPIKIEISGAPKETLVPIHPDKKQTRKVKVSDIYISKKDFDNFKGKEVRLLHLCNIFLKNKTSVSSLDIRNIPKINWVSKSVNTKILMENGTWINGIADAAISKLKPGIVVQFERNFFCRFDKKKRSTYEFWYSHK